MFRDRQRPLLGGVGFGAVGVEPVKVVVHHLGQLAVRAGGGRLGQDCVDLVEVDVLLYGGRAVLRVGDRGDRGDLVGGDPAGGEGGSHRRQVLQRPAGADQSVRGGRGQPAVTAEPGLHRREPVVLGGLGELSLPDRAGPAPPAGSARAAAARSGPAPGGRASPRGPRGPAGPGRLRDPRARHPNGPNTCTNDSRSDNALRPESPGQRLVNGSMVSRRTWSARVRRPPAADGSRSRGSWPRWA